VKDAVWAIARVAQKPAAVGEVFNIGGHQEIAIADLAAFAKRALRSASPIVHVPYDQAYEEGFEDMRRRVPDISKLQNLIGFSPRRTLLDIVLDVAAHQTRAARAAA
jgi:UDP-glucose 4-epimerase